MFKRSVLALTVAALAYTGAATAQENATLLLRSGETVSGQLIDMGGVGFTVRVNGQERQIPTGEVAVIDFTGNPSGTDWSKISAGQQVVMLRNGQSVDGQLYDISGTTPLKITIRTNSGEREFSSGEIGRIVLARPTNAVATSGQAGSTAGSGSGITVSGRQLWTPTGITVRRGERLTFNSTGEIQLGPDTNDIASVAGAKAQRFPGASAPMPRVYAGALIGRIGTGAPFAIGDQTSITAPANGQLFLGINDDNLNDNNGEYRVEISRAAQNRR